MQNTFSWHNRLPLQQYDWLKTPLITALGASTEFFFILSRFNKYDEAQFLF